MSYLSALRRRHRRGESCSVTGHRVLLLGPLLNDNGSLAHGSGICTAGAL